MDLIECGKVERKKRKPKSGIKPRKIANEKGTETLASSSAENGEDGPSKKRFRARKVEQGRGIERPLRVSCRDPGNEEEGRRRQTCTK
jgi:hypothetical protein